MSESKVEEGIERAERGAREIARAMGLNETQQGSFVSYIRGVWLDGWAAGHDNAAKAALAAIGRVAGR